MAVQVEQAVAGTAVSGGYLAPGGRPKRRSAPTRSALGPVPCPPPVLRRAQVISHSPLLIKSDWSGRLFFSPSEDVGRKCQFCGVVRRGCEVWPVVEAGGGATTYGPADESAHVRVAGRTYRFDVGKGAVAIKIIPLKAVHQKAKQNKTTAGNMSGEDPYKEIAVLQQLAPHGHASVEELIEAMEDDRSLYKVAPWYAGGELFDLAPMSEDVARPLFREILGAVAFLHSQGICHRDISLENILLDEQAESALTGSEPLCSGDEEDDERSCASSATPASTAQSGGSPASRPRLVDFGMSLRMPRAETGENLPLTPQGRSGKIVYMPPEVFFNDSPFEGGAVDVWCVGVALFLALLGVEPWLSPADLRFKEMAGNRRMAKVLEGWGLRSGLSDDAVDLLQAVLTADTAARLSDAEGMLAHPWFHASPLEEG